MAPLFPLLVLGCTPPDSPDDWGPYDVGATTISVEDPRGKVLTIEVWYPAVPGAGEPGPYPPTVLSLDAIRDAEPARPPEGETWPLVGFSHGNIAIRFQSAFLMEHLASHGFVIVAPDHKHNTLLDIDEDFTTQMLLERPDDVRFAIDAVIEDAGEPGLLSGLVAEGDWAMTGHSLGAFTALVVGGGELDIEAALAHCETSESPACDALSAELAAQLDQHGAADERVVATVAMSPLAWFAFGSEGEGLQSVRKPFVLAGELDEITPFESEIEPVYQALDESRRMLQFEGAGHYSFSDICLLVPAFFGECDPDAGYSDLATVQQQTRRAVTAFLKVELAGDTRYRRYLEPDAWDDDPGVFMRTD